LHILWVCAGLYDSGGVKRFFFLGCGFIRYHKDASYAFYPIGIIGAYNDLMQSDPIRLPESVQHQWGNYPALWRFLCIQEFPIRPSLYPFDPGLGAGSGMQKSARLWADHLFVEGAVD
jgi:hypothetical protein